MPNAQAKFFIAAPFGNYLKFENAISVKGTYTMLRRPGLVKQLIKTLRYDFNKKGSRKNVMYPLPFSYR